MANSPAHVRILLVEDDPADARLLAETFKELSLDPEVHLVATGPDAISYLRGTEPYVGVPRPDVVFLDLNLPRKDGREVLAEIRSDPRLNGIPVVILTSSKVDADVLHAFNFHAEGYVRKPVGTRELRQVMDRIEIHPRPSAS
jgi:CheY-like chemotaxis protein